MGLSTLSTNLLQGYTDERGEVFEADYAPPLISPVAQEPAAPLIHTVPLSEPMITSGGGTGGAIQTTNYAPTLSAPIRPNYYASGGGYTAPAPDSSDTPQTWAVPTMYMAIAGLLLAIIVYLSTQK